MDRRGHVWVQEARGGDRKWRGGGKQGTAGGQETDRGVLPSSRIASAKSSEYLWERVCVIQVQSRRINSHHMGVGGSWRQ